MSSAYRLVQWNRHKAIYDLILLAWIALYLGAFVSLGTVLFPAPGEISPAILLIRASGTCAILLLHLILVIGPLARLSPRMSPVLSNRRHLGVAFFLVASLHATLNFGFYGGFGGVNPVWALLAAPASSGEIPFELLGFLALLIFALMAATSHDFWLSILAPGFWKLLHMGVYLAYVLVLAHVALGVLRDEHNLIYPVLLTLGAAAVAGLHLLTGIREVRRDHAPDLSEPEDGWADVCSVDEIPVDRAKLVQIGTGERIAVFRHNNTVSAVSNVCAHQGGPLGEGKIINGCVTCPWHGYQYLAESGQSPPPYAEKIPTYGIRVRGRRVLINPAPNAPGTRVEPAPFEPWEDDSNA